jgi:non-histone chromosomal protein 6
MSTQTIKETARKLQKLPESAQRKFFEKMESRSELDTIDELVETAKAYSKSDYNALKKELARRYKNPNKPKGASAPFLHFSKVKVKSLKEETEGLTHKEATIQCGALWNAMSKAEKAPYVELFEKDKVRYAEAMKKFEAEHGADELEFFGKKAKKTRDPNLPKRNLNSYMFYSPNMVKELKAKSNMTHKEATVKAGEMWGQMSDADKKPFVDMASADKERYVREMAAFRGEEVAPKKESSKKRAASTTKTAPSKTKKTKR